MVDNSNSEISPIASAPRLVTVIIPVFNGGDYLALAIESALAQTWPAVEVLVVDDGSKDDGHTRKIAASYGDRIRFISKSNGGVATALNAGIEAMRGDWFSWLSHDDLYHPDKIKTQMEALSRARAESIAFGDYKLINETGEEIGDCFVRDFDVDHPIWAVLEGKINGCTILAPRALLIAAGGFHPGLPTTQDYELWFRLARQHRFVHVPGLLVSHRVHANQGSRANLSRHVEEAGLLWSEMLARVTPDEMRRHGKSELAFLLRAVRFLSRSSYPAGLMAAERLLRERLRDTRIVLVWCADAVTTPIGIIAALHAAGLRNVACMVVDLTADASASLELRTAFPDLVPIKLAPTDGLTGILNAAMTAERGDLVLLADHATVLERDGLRRAIEAIASGACDGWLQTETMPGGTLPAAFRGALLTRKAILAALDRSTALGCGDAATILGLVARLHHAPGSSGIPIPEAVPEPAMSAEPTMSAELAVSAEPPETPEPPIPVSAVPVRLPGPRPAPATSKAGIRLLGLADRWYRRKPGIYRFVSPVLAHLLGVHGLVHHAAYLAANPDVAAAQADPVLHYLRHGWQEGRDPAPHGAAKLLRPGLADTRPGIWLLDWADRLHRAGSHRAGPVRDLAVWLFGASGLVDGAAYRAANPDVAAAGADPILHFLRHGWNEGRDPRPALPQPTEHIPEEAEPPSPPSIPVPVLPVETPMATPQLPIPTIPARLLVIHTLGGGSLRYAELVAAHLRRHGVQPIFAWGLDNRSLVVSPDSIGNESARFELPAELDGAVSYLRERGVVRVDILQAMSIEEHIAAILESLGVPYDVTFLDYHLLSSSPHLLDARGDTAAFGQNAEMRDLMPVLRPLPAWVTDAAQHVACSRDLAARVERLAPGLRVLPVRTPESSRAETYRVTPPAPLGPSEPLRILTIGHLVPHKGRDDVLAAATEAKRRGLELEFHHVGIVTPSVSPAEQVASGIRLYGYFRREQLAAIVSMIGVHLAWFPTRAPETYGFALSEVMLMGLPILARGLGAYPERLAGRPYTWVTPAEETSTAFWLDQLSALRASNLAMPAQTPATAGLPPLVEDYYDSTYLNPDSQAA